MSKTIKQNLFRFVTLRNPQLIDNKEDHPGFVYHPDERLSPFFAAIEGVKDVDKRAKLDQVAETFPAFKTRKETRALNEKLYRFSSWLMRNKNNLSFASIASNLNGATPLDKDRKQDLIVWDNLIYQTIAKESVYVREALIQLLIANQFLEAFNQFSIGVQGEITFTDDQEKAFIRRANASVVLSKSLFDGAVITNKKTRKVSASELKRLESRSDVAIAKYEMASLKTLLEELKVVEVKYNKDNQKAYEDKLNEYNRAVEQLFADAKPVIIEETDPKTGEISSTKTYPDLVLPKFEFSKEEAIAESYLKSKIEGSSMAVFNKEKLEVYDTFNEVYQVLKAKIKTNNQTIFCKTPQAAKKLRIGGVTVKAQNNAVPYLDYNIPALMEVNIAGLASPFMVFYNVVETSQILSMTYTIEFEDGTSASETGFNIVPSSNDMIKFFPSGVSIPTAIETYTLSGEITLLSGETYSFDQLVRYKQRFNMGLFEAVDATTQTTTDEGRIYGVTNLGIADFRRVEQEVCCYVPGEVSHIENIMAREYKERSTRSLNSIETTTEETTERETEQLTDTTTTERNEMQSEVASVINEDQSQAAGASANMTYKPTGNLTIGAGAYADFSSSSSTSNSNSQAQTYAQEVTERAMERIVQKTTSKRTSRILREFEENNKHGFDNTKGDKHVTGVYRWVDKIYKNKLINYGKRLMYEFAIPEPSKFLKDAIWKNVDDNDFVSDAILPEAPVHPSLLAISVSDASGLDETNYQAIASEYNAEVASCPASLIIVGKAFSSSTQASDKNEFTEVLNFDEDYKLPEGYKTLRAKVACEVPQEGNLGGQVIVGTKTFGVSGYWTFNERFYAPIGEYVNTVPISFSSVGFHAANIGVNIECERTVEGFQQWQNETYNAIMDAYNERLREYNESVQANEIFTADREKLTFNPLHNRSLEQRELKRIAIDLLAEPKGHGDNVSKDDYVGGSNTEVNKSLALNTHAATVKFFEQAFDWDIMAYTFYPYFYAKQDDWKALFQSQDAADPLFQAFLQSGMARTVVPVRPGFEDAVNWYMSTGELWNGQGLVTDQDDDLYISVAEEMQTVEGEVEGTWETRLPTSLTIIQADAIGLDVEGLPCNLDCDDFALFDSDGNPELDPEGNPITNNPIKKKEVLLGVSEPTTTA